MAEGASFHQRNGWPFLQWVRLRSRSPLRRVAASLLAAIRGRASRAYSGLALKYASRRGALTPNDLIVRPSRSAAIIRGCLLIGETWFARFAHVANPNDVHRLCRCLSCDIEGLSLLSPLVTGLEAAQHEKREAQANASSRSNRPVSYPQTPRSGACLRQPRCGAPATRA